MYFFLLQLFYYAVSDEASCCGVHDPWWGINFRLARKILDDDDVFQTCLKEYKGVKAKNLERVAGEIVDGAREMYPNLVAARGVAALQEDR